jgi:hypothetical protein
MGQVFTEEEFGEHYFEFGLECDEVVPEKNAFVSGDGASLH